MIDISVRSCSAEPAFSPMRVEIEERDEIRDESSENKGAYCFICDRVRVDDSTT